MKAYTTIIKPGFAAIVGSLVILVGSTSVLGQEKSEAKQPTRKQTRQAGRDPFRKYEPPRAVQKAGHVMPPSIQERIRQYRAQKLAAMKARVPAPKPTAALLLSEVQVVGISRTPRGYAAIVEATPIKLSYVIYPGERFYDGQLVAIEDNRLVFRQELVFTDGRRERSVETKALRQPERVDEMAATSSVSSKNSVENASDQNSAVANQP